MRRSAAGPIILALSLALATSAEAGRVGPEFQLNTYTTKHQWLPAIAPLSNGGFIAAWTSWQQDHSWYGIFARRYNAAGVPEGKEFQVNSKSYLDQHDASVAQLSNGGVVFVWASHTNGGDGNDIRGQRFAAGGAKVGGEFSVNGVQPGGQETPAVAALSNGRFVVVWSSQPVGDGPTIIEARRYGANGLPLGEAFEVANPGSFRAVAAGLADGGFVVGWSGETGPPPYRSSLRRYNSAGVPWGNPFPVFPESPDFNRGGLSLAPLGSRGFLATWTEYPNEPHPTVGGVIYARRFNLAGTPGRRIRVDTFPATTPQGGASAAALEDGGFAVVWSAALEKTRSFDIYRRPFNAADRPTASKAILVNTFRAGSQDSAVVSGLGGGGFAVIWESRGQDGDEYGVYGQRFGP